MPGPTTLFESKDLPLNEILDGIKVGDIQLPEFQRELVWNLIKRRRLLQSIQRGFPAGSLLLMEVEGDPPFGFRPIRNMEHIENSAPKYLALDGQQRLSSLAHAFLSDQRSPNNYYLKLRALHMKNSSPEEIQLADDGIVIQLRKNQSRTDESALFEEEMLATHLIFDDDKRRQLLSEFKEKLRSDGDQALYSFIDTKFESYVDRFARYRFPVVIIKRQATLEVVSTIFTEINTQSQRLTSFDLCVAKFFQQSQGNFNLRNSLNQAKAANDNLNIVDGDGTNFLQSIALFADVVNKKASLPQSLNYEHVQTHKDSVLAALGSAAEQLKTLLKIEALAQIPYDALVPPLAKMMTEFPQRVADRGPVQQRIKQWVVASALKRRYTEGTDVVQKQDISEVVPWVLGNTANTPPFIREQWVIDEEVLNGSAASSRGKLMMLCLSMNNWTDPMFAEENIDSHHIFPSGYLNPQGRSSKEINRFLNRTWLSRATNQAIRNKAPSRYIREDFIPAVANRFNLTPPQAENKLREILRGHLINDESFDAMLADDYDAFIPARVNALASFLSSEFGIDSRRASNGVSDSPIDESEDEDTP